MQKIYKTYTKDTILLAPITTRRDATNKEAFSFSTRPRIQLFRIFFNSKHSPLRQFGYRTGQLECGRFPSCCSVAFWSFSKLTAIIELTTRYTLTRHESPETNMPRQRRPLQIFKLRQDCGEWRGEAQAAFLIGWYPSPAACSPASVDNVANFSYDSALQPLRIWSLTKFQFAKIAGQRCRPTNATSFFLILSRFSFSLKPQSFRLLQTWL